MLCTLPGLMTTVFLLWLGDFSRFTWIAVLYLLLFFSLVVGWMLLDSVRRPWQILSNILSAFGEQDYSMRGSSAEPGDPIGLAMWETNRLADLLQEERRIRLEQNLLLDRILRETDIAIFCFNADNRLVIVNQYAANLYGQLPEKLVGRTLEQLQLGFALTAAHSTGHSTFSMDHYEYAPGETHASGLRVVVFPGYFETVGTKILQGRDFLDTDNHESEKVVIIDQTLVDKYYSGQNPVGQTLQFWGQTLKIVGVVERVQSKPYFIKDLSVALYFPARQWDMDRFYTDFIVQVEGDPVRLQQTLRQAILDVDPKVTMEIHTFQEMFELATFAQQLPMMMTLFFATIAVLLTGIGLYGLISFTVMERTKEFGIRMALGAKPHSILVRILQGSGRLIALGLVIGLLISLVLCIRINPLLSDVHTLQPMNFTLVVLFVAGICVLASLVPALRATRVNVIDTLRYE